MIKNIEIKKDNIYIFIKVFFNILPVENFGLYKSDGEFLVQDATKNDETKTIEFRINVSLDNDKYIIKNKDTNADMLKVNLYVETGTKAPKINDICENYIIGQKFYEININKKPNTVFPPSSKGIYKIEEVEELHNFIHDGDYDRGFNDGFLIGKTL